MRQRGRVGMECTNTNFTPLKEFDEEEGRGERGWIKYLG